MTRILITGASGGLGGALVWQYAAPGVSLLLWGRDSARLEAIADIARAAGAAVAVRALDVTDIAAAIAAICAEDDDGAIDIAILAAGQGDIRAPRAPVEDAAQVARLGVVNFVAPSALASALAARMAARGRGRIVLVGSAAAFHALPFASGYAGSKAGLARFADALRIGVKPHGVSVTLVSPGFIDTSAARTTPGLKPFQLSAAQVAARIAVAAARGRAHVVMPWPFAVLRVFDRMLPRAVRDALLRALTPPGH